MTAHKHAAMIKAKADNMELVVLRKHHEGDWIEVADQSEIRIKQSGEYFLCLPQHKEACLHWLNGGEIEMQSDDDWIPVEMYKNTMPWHPLRIFMEDYTVIRIKPRKEKRWIGFNKHTAITTSTLYKSIGDIKGATVRHEEWQFIEIEVEI